MASKKTSYRHKRADAVKEIKIDLGTPHATKLLAQAERTFLERMDRFEARRRAAEIRADRLQEALLSDASNGAGSD